MDKFCKKMDTHFLWVDASALWGGYPDSEHIGTCLTHPDRFREVEFEDGHLLARTLVAQQTATVSAGTDAHYFH